VHGHSGVAVPSSVPSSSSSAAAAAAAATAAAASGRVAAVLLPQPQLMSPHGLPESNFPPSIVGMAKPVAHEAALAADAHSYEVLAGARTGAAAGVPEGTNAAQHAQSYAAWPWGVAKGLKCECRAIGLKLVCAQESLDRSYIAS